MYGSFEVIAQEGHLFMAKDGMQSFLYLLDFFHCLVCYEQAHLYNKSSVDNAGPYPACQFLRVKTFRDRGWEFAFVFLFGFGVQQDFVPSS